MPLRTYRSIQHAIVVSATLLIATVAAAQDPRTIAGPMRGSMHLGNLKSVAGQGMGETGLAIEGTGTINPAALAWFKDIEFELAYINGDFNRGPDVGYYYAEVTFPEPWLGGTIQLNGIGFSSETEDSNMGADTHFRMREVGFAYGVPLSDRVAIGVSGYPSCSSEVRIKTPGGDLVGRADGQVGSIRVGTLLRVLTHDDELFGVKPGKFNVAGVYTYIIDAWSTRGLPAGMDDDDTSYASKGNIGASYEPWKAVTLAFDYEIGHVSGVRIAGDNIDIISLGAEVRPTNWLQLRTGSSDSNFTAGLGLTFPRKWHIDYAYIDGGFEDVKKAFGRATVHSISVSKRF